MVSNHGKPSKTIKKPFEPMVNPKPQSLNLTNVKKKHVQKNMVNPWTPQKWSWKHGKSPAASRLRRFGLSESLRQHRLFEHHPGGNHNSGALGRLGGTGVFPEKKEEQWWRYGALASEIRITSWKRWSIHPIIYRVSTCFNHPFGGLSDFATIHSMATQTGFL